MALESRDLVVSYIVGANGIHAESYRTLREALDKGYRVLDVLSTATEKGTGGTGAGNVVVTVVLTTGSIPQIRYHMTPRTP